MKSQERCGITVSNFCIKLLSEIISLIQLWQLKIKVMFNWLKLNKFNPFGSMIYQSYRQSIIRTKYPWWKSFKDLQASLQGLRKIGFPLKIFENPQKDPSRIIEGSLKIFMKIFSNFLQRSIKILRGSLERLSRSW